MVEIIIPSLNYKAGHNRFDFLKLRKIMSLKANDRLFDSMSAMSKHHAENSGSYTFEKPAEPEPAPTVSLYNLLDHAPKDLIVAMVAFKNEAERIYDQRESSSNMADAYTSLCAWAKIFDTAINEKRDRDSEAWAEKTAKEILGNDNCGPEHNV